MMLAIIVLLVLMTVDHYLTWWIINYGGTEKNLFVRLLLWLGIGPWLWAGLKLALAIYLVIWSSTYYAWRCAGIFALACLWNYIQIRKTQC